MDFSCVLGWLITFIVAFIAESVVEPQARKLVLSLPYNIKRNPCEYSPCLLYGTNDGFNYVGVWSYFNVDNSGHRWFYLYSVP